MTITLNEKVRHESGAFSRRTQWAAGWHPDQGTLIKGLTGPETQIDRDVVKATGSFWVEKRVEFCNWCPDPHNPSSEYHPDGHPRHRLREKERRPAANKAENLSLLTSGQFGNVMRTWQTIEEVRASSVLTCGVRSRTPGGPCRYYVPIEELERVCRECGGEAATYFSESCPDDHLLIQGELSRNPTWHLFYSTAKLPMRKALAEQGRHADGVEVLRLLRSHCSPASFDMLQDILDRFDVDPVGECHVEFSTFGVHLGDIPGHNTIVWEVRRF